MLLTLPAPSKANTWTHEESLKSQEPRPQTHSAWAWWLEREGLLPPTNDTEWRRQRLIWKKLPNLAEKCNSVPIPGLGLVTAIPHWVHGPPEALVSSARYWAFCRATPIVGNSFYWKRDPNTEVGREWMSWTKNINEPWKGEARIAKSSLKH